MSRQLIITDHAEKRMAEYAISVHEVQIVIAEGEVIRRYPEDQPYESMLLLGIVDGCPLHVVAAEAHDLDATFVITVYEPDPGLWTDDFKTKRTL